MVDIFDPIEVQDILVDYPQSREKYASLEGKPFNALLVFPSFDYESAQLSEPNKKAVHHAIGSLAEGQWYVNENHNVLIHKPRVDIPTLTVQMSILYNTHFLLKEINCRVLKQRGDGIPELPVIIHGLRDASPFDGLWLQFRYGPYIY